MQAILKHIYHGNHITYKQSKQLFEEIIKGHLEPEQLAAVLISMKIRGEFAEEIAGAAIAFLNNANPFPRPNYLFADIAGTGGDGSNSINISTASAIVAAGCGIRIAKHGNCSISSRSGSYDLLAQFGIKLNTPSLYSRKALDKLNICFLFAPQYHSGFFHISRVRQLLKTRTVCNILGPLINPARPPIALIGVYSPKLILPISRTLRFLGYKRAAVVHGGGMDEIVLHAPNQISELQNGNIKNYILNAEDFGLDPQLASSIQGGSPKKNHNILSRLLQGRGEYRHEAAIAANVSLLLKLFGNENLIDNTQLALNEIRSGNSYIRLMNLAKIG